MGNVDEAKLQTLSEEVEELRTQLNKLGNSHGYSHPDVLAASEKLDERIVQFQQLKKYTKKPPTSR